MSGPPSRPASGPAPAPPGCRHGWADLAGVRLHYVLGGEGPVVVLVHGWPFSWIEWRATIPLLVRHGYTVLAPDLRGMGDSSTPPGHWSKRDEADDLHALLHHLGHKRAFVVGTDVGTMTAHAWAQAHPADVERLVLSESYLPGFGLEEQMNPVTGGSWHFAFHAQSEFAAELTAGQEDRYLSHFWSGMTTGGITEEDRSELLRTYAGREGMRGGFEHYVTLVQDGVVARAGASVQVPVLVLNGEHGLPQADLLRGARRAAEDVSADMVPGAAHAFAADNPAFTADRLARFFASGTVAG